MDPQESRPTPEEFLDKLKEEEEQSKQGRLKIFLGMAAGVGKTYAMLEEAHQLKEEGIEPVIGIVYTHGRQETENLVTGLKKIPAKQVAYKDKTYQEMDLEAILTLKPDLVLVDELAHSNIPGLRHSKRWQDVLEILDNGINVYTTLNIQHIESLNDIVKGIVEVSVRETVPDIIVERASSLRLVDIPPEELLHRLKEGKVYLGDQSRVAVENFFQRDRLTALREIVLRYAAEKVHHDLNKMPSSSDKRSFWKQKEMFLVAVSHSPHSQKLIRTCRRLAASAHASWVALHVDTGQTLNEEDSARLSKNLALARDLGAEIVSINHPTIVEGIKYIARQKGVTQIIIGRPPKPSILNLIFSPPLIDQLASECPEIDIHLIRQDRYVGTYRRKLLPWRIFSGFKDYVAAAGAVALLSGVNYVLNPLIGYKAVGIIFLLGIFFLSFVLKTGPILFSALLFAFVWDLFFIPPVGILHIAHNEDIFLLFLYVISAVIIGVLLERVKEHKDMLLKNLKSTDALFDLMKTMVTNKSTPEVFSYITKRLGAIFDGEFEIVFTKEGKLRDQDLATPLFSKDEEKNAANWSYANGKEAGWGTDTLPACQNLYLPIKGKVGPLGLFVYRPKSSTILSQEQKNFLYAASGQIAFFLERVNSEIKAHEIEQLHQVEKIHKGIIERFSLLFEKPFERAKDAISALKNKPKEAPQEQEQLIEIEHSLEMVTSTFANVNAISQLIEGLTPLVKEKHKVDAVVLECYESIKSTYPDRQIDFASEEHLPSVYLDAYLIKILIYNLLIFAVEHSPTGSTVRIRLTSTVDQLHLSILNEGPPIPEEQLGSYFEKFYCVPNIGLPNAGMGLAFAKAIAEMHKGVLRVENLKDQGIKIIFSVPLHIADF